MEKPMDIFDKVMKLPGLKNFESYYLKHKKVLLYLLFGGLTFIISVVSFAILSVELGMNELVANIISWFMAVMFAFFTNRIWVFSVPTNNAIDFLGQMLSFYAGRMITLLIEEILLFVFITGLGFPGMIIKIVAQLIVIIINYVISKLIIFKEN